MTTEEIIIELRDIGFTDFVHLRKEERDNKRRFAWTIPLENYPQFFTVTLLKENDKIIIEMLINPLGKHFDKNEIEPLIDYIRKVVLA